MEFLTPAGTFHRIHRTHRVLIELVGLLCTQLIPAEVSHSQHMLRFFAPSVHKQLWFSREMLAAIVLLPGTPFLTWHVAAAR